MVQRSEMARRNEVTLAAMEDSTLIATETQGTRIDRSNLEMNFEKESEQRHALAEKAEVEDGDERILFAERPKSSLDMEERKIMHTEDCTLKDPEKWDGLSKCECEAPFKFPWKIKPPPYLSILNELGTS